jgi:hypothetical protein
LTKIFLKVNRKLLHNTMKNFLLLISLGLIMFSCDKETDISRFYWNQTKCSDPWKTGEINSNTQTIEAVKDFLENKDIFLIEVDFDNNSPLDSTCKSCGCGTGQRVVVDVMKKDNKKMENLNFYK